MFLVVTFQSSGFRNRSSYMLIRYCYNIFLDGIQRVSLFFRCS